MKPRACVLSALVATLASGCMVGPDYRPPDVAAPTGWGELSPAAGTSEQPPTTASAVAVQRDQMAMWWTVFNDPHLSELMDWAAIGNLDLQQAEARIRQARAQRTIAAGPLWPTVISQASYAREHASANAPSGGATSGSSFDLYQVGFDASWELDVFGGNRRAVESAEASLEATQFDWAAVLVTLMGEVGSNYISYRTLQQRIGIANDNVKTQRDTLALTRRLFAAGLATDLDVARAEAQVETTEATIPQLTAQAHETMHLLGVLLGEQPMALAEDLAPVGGIPTGPPMVEVGIPSDLLLRRPDLRSSEQQLAAATANIGVAVRDLYPRFFVTGFGALESVKASEVFDWPSRAASIGPTISWTVFDAGVIRATVDLRTAQQQQLLAAYRSVVLQAFQEVEDALVAYAEDQKSRDNLANATAANQRAADLAKQLYIQGLTDFLSVLQAQFNLFTSQDALAQSEVAIALDLVALYKALGGGWVPAPPPPPNGMPAVVPASDRRA
jgi:NodT family efflux transporter outer membrane factor (OMF) lipoprotein